MRGDQFYKHLPNGYEFLPLHGAQRGISNRKSQLQTLMAKLLATTHGAGRVGSKPWKVRFTALDKTTKTMETRVSRLTQLNKKLSDIVAFNYDDDRKMHPLRKVGESTGVAGAGVGALYGRGLLAERSANRSAFTLPGTGINSAVTKQTPLQTMTRGAAALGSDAAKIGGGVKSAWSKILEQIAKRTAA